jgi:hypothetical protein
MNSQVNATGHEAVRSRIRHQEFMIRCVKMQVYVRQALEGLAPQEPRVEPSCAYSFRLERGPEYLVVNQHFSGKLVLHGTDGPLFRRAVEIVVRGYHRRYSKFNMSRSGYHLN